VTEPRPSVDVDEPAPGLPTVAPEPTRPGRYLLVAAVVLALTILAVAVGVPPLVRELRPPDLSAVETWDGLEVDHVPGDVDYPMTPPAGGPHADAWLACGSYDEPVPDENAVHALEHGTVWITHDPGLSGEEVERLRRQLPGEGILSPHDDLPGVVVVTVWGRRLVLDGADDPRLGLFLEEYGDGHTSPEPFASCEGGVDASGEPAGPEQSA
jgi:hypothetical protein